MLSAAPLTTCHLPDDAATARYGEAWGKRLRAGDVLLLEGGIGAGKTAFARALIQSRLTVPEDVPSPTFTLVQVYDTPETEIWHCDLYRLTGPDEVIELGLEAAMDTALCLIEWPDRLGEIAPDTALTLRFTETADGTARDVSLYGAADLWANRLPACAA